MTGRKRIALVLHGPGTSGGVASVAAFLLRTIRRREDFEVRLITLSLAARDPLSVRLTAPASWLRGVATATTDFDGQPFTSVGAFFSEIETQRYQPRPALTRLLSDVDLIQVVAGTPAWANAVAGLGKPVSLQVATLTAHERRRSLAQQRGVEGAWRRLMAQRLAAMETRALRAVDAVQVENRWMERHVRKATAGLAVDVRHASPGVDVELFRPARKRYLEQADQYIISVGRMRDPRKNHMYLLEAYRHLAAGRTNPPRLVLAGPGTPSPEFEAAASAAGLRDRIEVHSLPDRPKLARLIREAEMTILASEEEGFGIVVIEAMASGIPVIATRSGGPEEIVTEGEDGFLVPLDDATEVARCAAMLLDDRELNLRMGAAGRRKALTRYSERAAGDRFLDVFDLLLARGPREARRTRSRA